MVNKYTKIILTEVRVLSISTKCSFVLYQCKNDVMTKKVLMNLSYQKDLQKEKRIELSLMT